MQCKALGMRVAGAKGRFVLACFRRWQSMFLRELIGEYANLHPGVEIDIMEGAPREHIRRIRDRSLDVAFVTGVPDAPGCDVKQFWCEQVFVVLPDDHPLTRSATILWEALRSEPIIVSREEPGPEIHDYVIRHLADLGHHPSVAQFAVGREI
jgi:DNA-binding transcriptional LysR family regulator